MLPVILALLACEPTSTPEVPFAQAPASDAPSAFVTWHARQTAEGTELLTRTWATAGGEPEAASTLDGLLSVQTAGVVRLTQLHRDEPATDCDGNPANNRQAAPGLSRPGQDLQVLDLLPEDPTGGTFRENLTVDGIVGDVAFVRASSVVTPCDGPARTSWEAMELDLSQGYTAEVFTPEEREATMNALRPAAFEQLQAKGATASTPEDLIWSATRPAWSGGALTLQVLLTSPAPEGDGSWNPGTLGVWLDAPTLPARLQAHAALDLKGLPVEDGFLGAQQITGEQHTALKSR